MVNSPAEAASKNLNKKLKPPTKDELLQELLDHESFLRRAIYDQFLEKQQVTRTELLEVVDHLTHGDYMKLYKRIKAIGFSPTLMPNSEECPKEKQRVATFISRLFADSLKPVEDFFPEPMILGTPVLASQESMP